MAIKRMFSNIVVDTDTFTDMPPSAQALYYTLAMRADDEGFVRNTRSIISSIGCIRDDLKTLADNGYVIKFDSRAVVITHWYVNNNYKDKRINLTFCKKEKEMLMLDENDAYVFVGKDKEKASSENLRELSEYGIKFEKPSVEEIAEYCREKGYAHVDPQNFFDYYEGIGWMVGIHKIKNWRNIAGNWERRILREDQIKKEKAKNKAKGPQKPLETKSFETQDFFDAAIENSYGKKDNKEK